MLLFVFVLFTSTLFTNGFVYTYHIYFVNVATLLLYLSGLYLIFLLWNFAGQSSSD